MVSNNNLKQLCTICVKWLNEEPLSDPNWSSEMWSTFKQCSLIHGVSPRLYQRCNKITWLDTEVEAWLKRQYRFNKERITKMHQALKEVLALFSEHNLAVIPLKGAVLSTLYYNEPALRPMSDLDLLVQPQDFEKAHQLLLDLGYIVEKVSWKHLEFVKPNNQAVVSRTDEHPDNPRRIELHQACLEMFGGVKIELTSKLWANAQTGQLLDYPALIIPTDLLWLHLVIHANSHLWQGTGRLTQLLDIVKLSAMVNNPLDLLNSVDARFTHITLTVLTHYFPDVLDKSIMVSQKKRVSKAFQQWASSFDLVTGSHLNPQPQFYLNKVLRFSEGRPSEIKQILQYVLWPNVQSLKIDPLYLAQHKHPNFYLLQQRLKHLLRLLLRATTKHVG